MSDTGSVIGVVQVDEPQRVPMTDIFRFVVTDAAEAIVVHEALMSYRNRDSDWPADVLRREAADRLLARMGLSIGDLHAIRLRESQMPVNPDLEPVK